MMTSGTSFRQKDIVVVPLPFSDLSSAKQRPALILSNDAYNSSCGDVLVCGITSNLKDASYSTLIDINDFKQGSLPVLSRIKADKIFSLDKSIIRKRVAVLSEEKFEEVKSIVVSLMS
ncbi:MAG TPA: type II toxin-antitoxin system PemK/MazF family toxin [Candidatus Nanoarchaeia archaeon]|nr:type II toxin-antitoxin system PemK/MazF family toxin [Candidatus Nanoarchaeia archaeon]